MTNDVFGGAKVSAQAIETLEKDGAKVQIHLPKALKSQRTYEGNEVVQGLSLIHI